MNYYARKYGMFDEMNVEFVKQQRQALLNAEQKRRHDEWLRENIASELEFLYGQRNLWTASLEELKKKPMTPDNQAMIMKIERDLGFNAERLVEYQKIYIKVRSEILKRGVKKAGVVKSLQNER